MDKQENTRTWLKFFKDAGIPTKSGASYALIFVENRIHMDMLSDLTVDYLRLMGITLMGDVIAILRHSRSVHQDSLRKVVILQSKEETPTAITSSRSTSSSSDESSDDVEMVEISKSSSKKMSSLASKISDQPKRKESPPQDADKTKQIKSKVIEKLNSNKTVEGSEKKIGVQSLKRKCNDESIVVEEPAEAKTTTPRSSAKSILKTPTSTAKKMRITSENDIIGPKLPPPKKTVFQRLGAETSSPQVSSTTEVPKLDVMETTFTRTVSHVQLPLKKFSMKSSMDSMSKGSSVFSRLGGLRETKQVDSPLKYVGVLKSPPSAKKALLNTAKRVGTMRADEPQIPVKLRAATKSIVSASIKVRERESTLKQQRLTKAADIVFRKKILNHGSQGIFANPGKSLSVSVKQRLGITDLEKMSFAKPTLQRHKESLSRTAVKYNSSYEDCSVDNEDNKNTFPSHVEILDFKKVSFGKVEQKLFSPIKSIHGGSGVHSRLGLKKYT